MWLKQAALIVLLVSRIAMSLFALDILLWTFGAEIIPPFDALLRLGIWCVPCLLPFFFPKFSLYLRKPVIDLLSEIQPKEDAE